MNQRAAKNTYRRNRLRPSIGRVARICSFELLESRNLFAIELATLSTEWVAQNQIQVPDSTSFYLPTSVVVAESQTNSGANWSVPSVIDQPSITFPAGIGQTTSIVFPTSDLLAAIAINGYHNVAVTLAADEVTLLQPILLQAPQKNPVAPEETDSDSSDETASDETTSDETTSDETTNDETASDETASDETASDETASDETASDETASDETASDENSADESFDDDTSENLDGSEPSSTVPGDLPVVVPPDSNLVKTYVLLAWNVLKEGDYTVDLMNQEIDGVSGGIPSLVGILRNSSSSTGSDSNVEGQDSSRTLAVVTFRFELDGDGHLIVTVLPADRGSTDVQGDELGTEGDPPSVGAPPALGAPPVVGDPPVVVGTPPRMQSPPPIVRDPEAPGGPEMADGGGVKTDDGSPTTPDSTADLTGSILSVIPLGVGPPPVPKITIPDLDAMARASGGVASITNEPFLSTLTLKPIALQSLQARGAKFETGLVSSLVSDSKLIGVASSSRVSSSVDSSKSGDGSQEVVDGESFLVRFGAVVGNQRWEARPHTQTLKRSDFLLVRNTKTILGDRPVAQTQPEPEHFVAPGVRGDVLNNYEAFSMADFAYGELSELDANELQLVSHTVSIAKRETRADQSGSGRLVANAAQVDRACAELATEGSPQSNTSIHGLWRESIAFVGRSPVVVLLIGGSAVVALRLLKFRKSTARLVGRVRISSRSFDNSES